MAKKAKDAGEKFLGEILSLLPEADRADIKAKLGTKDDVLERLGDGVLQRAEATRLTQQLADEKKALDAAAARNSEWWKLNVTDQGLAKVLEDGAAAIARLKALGDGGDDPEEKPKPRSAPAPQAVSGLDAEAVQKLLEARVRQTESDGMAVMVMLDDLGERHRDEFKKRLDRQAFMKFAGEKNKPLDDAYELFVAEARGEQQKKEREEEIAAAEKRGMEKARRESAGRGLPHMILDDEPSPLMRLKSGDKQSDGVKAAIDDFYSGKFAEPGAAR
jgi:hypothetical protein